MPILGEEKGAQTQTLGPDIFRWCGVFHVQGWGGGGQKVRYVLRIRNTGRPNFLAGYPGMFAGISWGRPKIGEKLCLCSIFGPYSIVGTDIPADIWGLIWEELKKAVCSLRGENPGAFPKAWPIFQQPFSLPENAQTLAGIAFRAAGKSVSNYPAASKLAGKLFQQRISDSHGLLSGPF